MKLLPVFCTLVSLSQMPLSLAMNANNTLIHPKEIKPSKPFMNKVDDASFEDLFDLQTQENPDWTANSPTKVPLKSSQSPANVVIITKHDIQTFGYQSISEILSHVAGFVKTNDLTQSNFGVRGVHPGSRAGNRIIKVMIDGHPISFRSNDHNWIDENLIPMPLVERVEIIKGPVSALYGANAFLGVVNVITKQADEFVRKGQIIELGYLDSKRSDPSFQISLAGGYKNSNWSSNYGFSVTSEDRSGLQLPISSPSYQTRFDQGGISAVTSKNDEADHLVFYSKSRYQSTQNDSWQLGIHYQEIDADQSFSDLVSLSQFGNNHIELYNGFARLDYLHRFSGQWEINTNLAYSEGAPKSSDRIEVGAEQFFLKRNFGYQALDFGAELSFRPDTRDFYLFGINTSTANQDIETYDRIERVSRQSTALNQKHQEKLTSSGLYWEWLANWKAGFSTLVGYRLDTQDIYSNQHSGRIGIVFPITPKHSLKFLLGSSFQAPSAELLFRTPAQSGDIIGNRDLEPQQAETAEMILSGALMENLRYSGTLFFTRVNELVTLVPQNINQVAQNSDDSRTRGIELESSYKKDDFELYGNLSWQKTNIPSTHLFILDNRPNGQLYPEWSGNFGFSYQFEDSKIQLSLDNSYVGLRPASNSNVRLAGNFLKSSDYVDTTLTIQKTWRWLKNHDSTVKLQIRDLWDENYANPGFGGVDVPSLGRRLSLTINQRF